MKKLLSILLLCAPLAFADEVRVGTSPAEAPVQTTTITDATATTFTTIGVPVQLDNNFTTGTVNYTIHCHDGTTSNSGTLKGHVDFSCSNVLGSEACSFATVSADNSVSEDRGTYGIGTTTFAGANPGVSVIDLQVNSDCTGVVGPDTMYMEWSIDVQQQTLVTGFTGGEIANPLLLPDGSESVPSLAFTNSTDTGIFMRAAGYTAFSQLGTEQFEIGNLGPVSKRFSLTGAFGSVPDVYLERDAANTLALRNSTNAQTFNIYNTYTDGSNYERAGLYWSSNLFNIDAQSAGTGTNRALIFNGSTLYFRTGGTGRWEVGANEFRPTTTDIYGIGSTTRSVQDIYLTEGILGSKSKALADETKTDIVKIAIADAAHAAGKIKYSVHDATSDDAVWYEVSFACVNNADTEACTVSEDVETLVGTDGDTIDCTLGIDEDETNAVMVYTTCDQEDDDDAMTGYFRLDTMTTGTQTWQ